MCGDETSSSDLTTYGIWEFCEECDIDADWAIRNMLREYEKQLENNPETEAQRLRDKGID